MLKKAMSIFIVLLVVLGCFGFVACGGGEENGAAETANGDITPPVDPVDDESEPSGTLSWGDIPTYPGASQVQKGSWAIPAEQGEWSKMEWRYYETRDSADDVAAYYKSRMPGNGWSETMWMEAEGIAWAYYTKNGENDGAMFWTASDEGETFFALMRATQ